MEIRLGFALSLPLCPYALPRLLFKAKENWILPLFLLLLEGIERFSFSSRLVDLKEFYVCITAAHTVVVFFISPPVVPNTWHVIPVIPYFLIRSNDIMVGPVMYLLISFDLLNLYLLFE